jgi:hypothetical protein
MQHQPPYVACSFSTEFLIESAATVEAKTGEDAAGLYYLCLTIFNDE